jgi:indole-3-glycerol phosphate synthase
MDILEKIVAAKKKRLEELKGVLSHKALERLLLKEHGDENICREYKFKKALSSTPKNGIHLIAEIKSKSPIKGVLCPYIDPLKVAISYRVAGATALSVLTEERFFGGRITDLSVGRVVDLPVLRKDFIFDEYQVLESRLFSADAILLIARILSEEQLTRLVKLSKSLFMDTLVEVYDKAELDKVLGSPVAGLIDIIGINNRDLRTFKVNIRKTVELINYIPHGKIIICESGIKTKKDIDMLKSYNINGVLIGESLITSRDVIKKIRSLGFLKEGVV